MRGGPHNKPDKSFNKPKRTKSVGTLNVTTLFEVGKTHQVMKEMKDSKCEMMGLSEADGMELDKTGTKKKVMVNIQLAYIQSCCRHL